MVTEAPNGQEAVGGTLDELGSQECWELLATGQVGRLAVVVGQHPLVFPVNYGVVDRHIVFQSGADQKLWAINHSNVTFQVDEIDPSRRTGWSVMVQGAARELTFTNNPGLYTEARRGAARPWAPGKRDHLVWVVADRVSGRRITPPAEPEAEA